MSKRVMQYRECDKCNDRTEAVVTERLTYNGESFVLDLCQKHCDLLESLLESWTSVGALVNTSRLDARRTVTGPTVVSLEPLQRVIPAAEPMEPVEVVTRPARVLPAYPLPAERWDFTQHTHQRMKERGITEAQVRYAAERPEISKPSRTEPSCEKRERGGVIAVVNPYTETVVTTYHVGDPEDVADGATKQKAEAR